MHLVISCSIFLFLLSTQQAWSSPLTVVADKSGEQQVKEALKKAEQEAEKAAKEGKQKDPKDGDSKLNTRSQAKQAPLASEGDQDESNKRMKEMAAKLNSLVVKFQKKVIANKLHNALQRRVALSKAMEKVTQGKRETQHQKSSSFDLGNLDPLASVSNGMGNAYKEDTKLEDRLALEAEEEKKFNNGETYEDDGAYHDSTLKSYAGTTSLSPKEQASQEMQRYNALISSESSRELSQIQDEISKATQSSMGKVSVQGENPSVSAEQAANNGGVPQSLDLGGLGGLSSQSINVIQGLGSIDSSSNAINIGNPLEGASLGNLAGTQTESFAGNIGVTGDSQAENQEVQTIQNSPGMISTGADVQGNGLETQTGETDISAAQHLFNKKSKITKNKKKTKIPRKTRKSKISRKKD